MGWRWSVKRLALVLTGRGARALAEERDRHRAALVQPWFDANGDETLRLDYPLIKESLVLDLGGYRGQYASDLFGRFGCRVMVFEPVEDFCQHLRWRFKFNPAVQIFNFGLADRDCEITLNIDGASTTAFAGHGHEVKSQLKGVGAFFTEHGLAQIDLVKINIEGGEYDLLDAMLDQGLVSKVSYFQIQFHDHVPGAEQRVAHIRNRLQETHVLQWSFPWVWESWQRKSVQL